MSTSGNQEYASMAIRRYSLLGKGPQKSMWTVCHGVGGNDEYHCSTGVSDLLTYATIF